MESIERILASDASASRTRRAPSAPRPATWGGSRSATVSSTNWSTAGANTSMRWSFRSSRSSCTHTTRRASDAGSRSSTASASARSFWFANRTRSRDCDCCSSSPSARGHRRRSSARRRVPAIRSRRRICKGHALDERRAPRRALDLYRERLSPRARGGSHALRKRAARAGLGARPLAAHAARRVARFAHAEPKARVRSQSRAPRAGSRRSMFEVRAAESTAAATKIAAPGRARRATAITMAASAMMIPV